MQGYCGYHEDEMWCGSNPRVIFVSLPPWGHLELSGDIVVVTTQ